MKRLFLMTCDISKWEKVMTLRRDDLTINQIVVIMH